MRLTTEAGERDGTITSETGSGSCVVRLHGEHDVATAPALREAIALAEAAGDEVVLDFRACTFIDSSVIAELLRARRNRPVQLVLSEASDDAVRRTLELCGVLGLFDLGGDPGPAQAAPT